MFVCMCVDSESIVIIVTELVVPLLHHIQVCVCLYVYVIHIQVCVCLYVCVCVCVDRRVYNKMRVHNKI